MHETIPGHRALRKGRESIVGQVYLITTTTHRRVPLFHDWRIAAIAARAITESAAVAGVELLCWVLMPDHWHALARLGPSRSLSQSLNRIKGCSAIAVNRAAARSGHVWAKGFHDHALRRDEDAVTVARYVIANPVRAGIVERVGDYSLWDAVWLDGANRSPASGLLQSDPG